MRVFTSILLLNTASVSSGLVINLLIQLGGAGRGGMKTAGDSSVAG